MSLIPDLKGSNNLLGAIGIISGIILSISPLDRTLPIKYLLGPFIIVISIILLYTNHYQIQSDSYRLDAEKYRTEAEKYVLPKVIYGKPPYDGDEFSVALCILKPSKSFFQDMLVSFYHKDSKGFEDIIGIGRVKNIQNEGNIQIEMNYYYTRFEEIVTGCLI